MDKSKKFKLPNTHEQIAPEKMERIYGGKKKIFDPLNSWLTKILKKKK